MRTFEVREVLEIKARERVDQLYIDGIGQIQAFENKLKGSTYMSELKQLMAYITRVAQGESAGPRMIVLKNPKPGGQEYEFKSKHLRIYAIQRPDRKIIIFCGVKKKADSSDNIKAFRLLKEYYLDSIK